MLSNQIENANQNPKNDRCNTVRTNGTERDWDQ